MEVMEVALDQSGPASERRLAFVDKNRDLYLTQVRVYGSARKTVKLSESSAVTKADYFVCNCVTRLLISPLVMVSTSTRIVWPENVMFHIVIVLHQLLDRGRSGRVG